MEIGISNKDAKTLGLDSRVKRKIVALTHDHLGYASVVSVKIVEDPQGVQLEIGGHAVVVDRALTKRIDAPQEIKML